MKVTVKSPTASPVEPQISKSQLQFMQNRDIKGTMHWQTRGLHEGFYEWLVLVGALAGTTAVLHGSPRPHCGCCSLGLAEPSSDPAQLCCSGQGCCEAEPSAHMGLPWWSHAGVCPCPCQVSGQSRALAQDISSLWKWTFTKPRFQICSSNSELD